MLRRLFKSRTTTPRPASINLEVEGRVIPIQVRESARARRMSLRVRRNERDVVLVLPPRISVALAESFVLRHRDWVAARFDRLPEGIPLADGALVPLRGKLHRVTWSGRLRGIAQVRSEDAVIEVSGAPESLPRRLTDFLKAEARRDFEEAVARHARSLGVTIRRIRIKDTRSRWGSCSASGDLAFSWRMIMAPPFVLDYLAAHEVAHRREMNHSPRYWALVRSLPVNVDAAERWLNEHGPDLHRYTAA